MSATAWYLSLQGDAGVVVHDGGEHWLDKNLDAGLDPGWWLPLVLLCCRHSGLNLAAARALYSHLEQ